MNTIFVDTEPIISVDERKKIDLILNLLDGTWTHKRLHPQVIDTQIDEKDVLNQDNQDDRDNQYNQANQANQANQVFEEYKILENQVEWVGLTKSSIVQFHKENLISELNTFLHEISSSDFLINSYYNKNNKDDMYYQKINSLDKNTKLRILELLEIIDYTYLFKNICIEKSNHSLIKNHHQINAVHELLKIMKKYNIQHNQDNSRDNNITHDKNVITNRLESYANALASKKFGIGEKQWIHSFIKDFRYDVQKFLI